MRFLSQKGENYRYKPTNVVITENGVDEPGEFNATFPDVLQDDFRIDYFKGYIQAAADAVTKDQACLPLLLSPCGISPSCLPCVATWANFESPRGWTFQRFGCGGCYTWLLSCVCQGLLGNRVCTGQLCREANDGIAQCNLCPFQTQGCYHIFSRGPSHKSQQS
jgi:Glycosyl hydrolase family 1